MEDFRRRFQHDARRRRYRREDILLSRRPLAAPAVDGADQQHSAPHRHARIRSDLLFYLIR